MHPCLRIPEILTTIFEEVQNERRELGALATTCKTFSGPAVAILWRTLFSNPVPLLLAMPSDLWELEEIPQKDGYCDVPVHLSKLLTFKRDVVPEDWQHFDFYAQFVKVLGLGRTYSSSRTISQIDSITIHERIFHELERRDCVLLPNLKTMIIRGCPSHYSSLFLAPATKHLEFQTNTNNTNICRFMDDVPLRSPHLRSIHLVRPSGWMPAKKRLFAAPLLRLLNRLQDIEQFYCDWFPLSDEITITLLQMSNLSKMTICRETAALERMLLDDKVEDPHLEEVTIRTDRFGVRSLAELLISLRPTLLTSFYLLAVRGYCYQVDLGGFFHAIGKHCSPTRFAELTLVSHSFKNSLENSLENSTTIYFSTLGPLLPFSQLRVLVLHHHPFDLTDGEIKEMAMAWPNLTKLESKIVTTTPETRTTIWGLLWLATFCRKLKYMTFNFNGTKQISPDELALAANHGLTSLDVGDSMFDELEDVVEFMSVVFPTLVRITHCPSSKWDQVENLRYSSWQYEEP